MKLSKQYLSQVPVLCGSLKQIDSVVVLNLLGHIKALEEELSNIKPGYEYVATRVFIGAGILSERAGYPLKVKRCSKDQWIVASGKYEGQIIHESNCEEIDVIDRLVSIDAKEAGYTEIHQELLQKREEVGSLMRDKTKLMQKLSNTEDAYRRIFGKLASANTSINRYAIELYKEREDKALLLQTIEQEADARKPTQLPQKVTDAIRVCLNAGMSRILIITNMEQIEKLFRDYERPVLHALAVIRDFAWQTIGGGQDLLEGLAAMKVVQQTPEERLLKYFETVTPKGWKFTGDGNDPVYIERSAIRTTCSILGKEIDGINSKQ